MFFFFGGRKAPEITLWRSSFDFVSRMVLMNALEKRIVVFFF